MTSTMNSITLMVIQKVSTHIHISISNYHTCLVSFYWNCYSCLAVNKLVTNDFRPIYHLPIYLVICSYFWSEFLNSLWATLSGATCGTGAAYPSRAPEITPNCCGACIAKFLVFYVVVCLLLCVCVSVGLFPFYPWHRQSIFELWVWMSIWHVSLP